MIPHTIHNAGGIVLSSSSMHRANLRIAASREVADRHDPHFGHVPKDHGELAVRAVALHHARLDGHDIEFELNRLVKSWESNR